MRIPVAAGVAALILGIPAGAVATGASPLTLQSTITLQDHLKWYARSEAGFLHIYSGNTIRSIDLRSRRIVGSPTEIDDGVGATSLPGTDQIVVWSNRGDGQSENKVKEHGGSWRMVLYDFQAGKIVWTLNGVGEPAGLVAAYAASRLVLLQANGHLLGISLTDGTVKWSSEEEYFAITMMDGVLLGKSRNMFAIDPARGTISATFQLPTKLKHVERSQVEVLPDFRHVMYRFGYQVALMEGAALNAPAQQAAEPTRIVWKAENVLSMQEAGKSSTLIATENTYQLRNRVSGQIAWERPRQDDWFSMIVMSPGASTGIDLRPDDKVIQVVDMRSGKTARQFSSRLVGSGAFACNHEWRNNTIVSVEYCEENIERPVVAKGSYDVGAGKVLWETDLPENAKYDLTAGERGKAIGRAVGSAVSMAGGFAMQMNGLATGNRTLYVVGGGLYGGGRGSIGYTMDGLGFDAADRSFVRGQYPSIAKRLSEREATYDGRRNYALTGKNGSYRLVALDLSSGALSDVAPYVAEKVHGIVMDTPYDVMVTFENNKKTLRILSWTR